MPKIFRLSTYRTNFHFLDFYNFEIKFQCLELFLYRIVFRGSGNKKARLTGELPFTVTNATKY